MRDCIPYPRGPGTPLAHSVLGAEGPKASWEAVLRPEAGPFSQDALYTMSGKAPASGAISKTLAVGRVLTTSPTGIPQLPLRGL